MGPRRRVHGSAEQVLAASRRPDKNPGRTNNAGGGNIGRPDSQRSARGDGNRSKGRSCDIIEAGEGLGHDWGTGFSTGRPSHSVVPRGPSVERCGGPRLWARIASTSPDACERGVEQSAIRGVLSHTHAIFYA
jgi:hypothetical protein